MKQSACWRTRGRRRAPASRWNGLVSLLVGINALVVSQPSFADALAPVVVGVTSRKRNGHNRRSLRNEVLCLYVAKREEQQDQKSNVKLLADLSDEELLLACRAYLQKKNRLGQWKEAKERKRKREQQQKLARGSQSGGFFWDDPSELKYYQQPNTATSSSNQTDDDWSEDVEGNNHPETTTTELLSSLSSFSSSSVAVAGVSGMSTTRLEQVEFDFIGQSENDHLEEWSREFSTFAAEPSETRIRRSQGAKKRWEDPAWKAMWYEKRWGKKKQKLKNQKTTTKTSKKPQQSTSSPPPFSKRRSPAFTMAFMNSPEFKSLTEEEIAEAATMYQQANLKRAKSHKQTRQARKDILQQQNDAIMNDDGPQTARVEEETTQPIPRDSLLLDQDAMRERRRLRAETAKKAYETRLQNKSNNNKPSVALSQEGTKDTDKDKDKLPVKPSGDTPQEAMKRIEMDLDQEQLPQLEDLVLIAGRGNLGGRKQLMRRLLAERFNLRGKCVPSPTSSDDPDKMIFVTNCTVKQLMDFCIAKVKEETTTKQN